VLRRPAQRRQVHPHEHAGRREGRHHIQQAADDTEGQETDTFIGPAELVVDQRHDVLVIDVALAVGDFVTSMHDPERSPFSRDLVIFDRDRLGVIVIDGRGIVQYLGPIAPNSDDSEAVLEELLAVADLALRAK